MPTSKLSPPMVYALRGYANCARDMRRGAVLPYGKPRTVQALLDRGLIFETLREMRGGGEVVTVPTRAGWAAIRDLDHAEADRFNAAIDADMAVVGTSTPAVRSGMPIGPRGEVRTYEPTRDGAGVSRMWRREINGTMYAFTVVNMPDGELRLAVNKYNGYLDGHPGGREAGMQYGCAWDRVHFVRMPAERGWFGERAPVLREGAEDPHWSCGKTAIPCPDGTHGRPRSTDDGSRLMALGTAQRNGLIHTFELISVLRNELPYALYVSIPGMSRMLCARTLTTESAYALAEMGGEAVRWSHR